MSNVHGTWRCVCEQNTEHIHLVKVLNHDVELAICNLHLLACAVQAGLGISDLGPLQFSGAEAVEEQCAWYVEVCVSWIRCIST